MLLEALWQPVRQLKNLEFWHFFSWLRRGQFLSMRVSNDLSSQELWGRRFCCKMSLECQYRNLILDEILIWPNVSFGRYSKFCKEESGHANQRENINWRVRPSYDSCSYYANCQFWLKTYFWLTYKTSWSNHTKLYPLINMLSKNTPWKELTRAQGGKQGTKR